MAINLQQFLAKQLSDGVIDQQLCDLLNANTRKNLTSSQMKSLWKALSGPVP